MVKRFLRISLLSIYFVLVLVITLTKDPFFIEGNNSTNISTGMIRELNGLYSWPLDLIKGRNINIGNREFPLIAVIDSGVNLNNKYLCDGCIKQISLVDDSTKIHGTLVTGLIIGNGDGITTPRGLLPNSNLLSIEAGTDNGVTIENLIRAIDLAVESKAKVINISLTTKIKSEKLEKSIENAIAEGTIIIASAGNEGEEMNEFPGRYKNVIAVSALTKSGVLDERSNYAIGNIAAPGNYLLTTGNTSNDMDWFSGTSAATPLVTSVVSIMLTICPNLNANEIKEIILDTATKKNMVILL